jgi:5-methylthioribose kinase
LLLESTVRDGDKTIMLVVDVHNAVEYLRDRGWIDSGTQARAELLAWGVSNAVLRITLESGLALVLKQSRAQLRTKDPWFSRLDRIWRETAVLRLLERLLPPGVVPKVLFEDRDNFLFGMEAAPANHVVWKQLLLEGHPDTSIARRLGSYLGTIHRQTARRPDLLSQFGDTEVFVQLRIDPFYRRIAADHAEAAAYLSALIDEMFSLPICLVLADFSPKNVLIAGEQIVLVDFETGHYGDPAFDLGFFLSHLLLKGIRHAARFAEFAALTMEFWGSYFNELADLSQDTPFARVEILRRTTAHLAGCMWARIDGTSKIDYLGEAQQNAARDFCRSLFRDPPSDWQALLERESTIVRARRLDTTGVDSSLKA